MQIIVRDNNVEQALRALKKKLQREGVYREMKPLLTDEAGMTLVELLIAMTLMAVGIAAIVAGYTSGVFAITRADKATVAASVADQQMETYHQEPYSAITIGGPTTTSVTGSDGRSYSVTTTVAWACIDSATPPSCTGSAGEPVKQVTISVVDPSNSKTLYTEGSTFDSQSG